MRSLIVTAGLASVLASAPGAGAAPGISGGAPKVGNQDARPAAVAADVPATEVTSTIQRTPAPAGATGPKSKSLSVAKSTSRIIRTATAGPQKRLTITRVVPVRTARSVGVSTEKPRTAAKADVPLSVVKTTIVPTRAPAGVKNLARATGADPSLSLHSTSDKFSASAHSKTLPE